MPHPDELELQGYYDGELSEVRQQRLGQHLTRCSVCRGRVRELQALSKQVLLLQPATTDERSEGEFWSRLAGQLQGERRPVWPLTGLLPPLALTLLGLPLQVLISVALTLYALASLWPANTAGNGLEGWLTAQITRWGFIDALGLGDHAASLARAAAQPWERMDWLTRDTLALVAVLLALGVLLLVVAAVYLSWAVCWTRSRSARKGGNGTWTMDASSSVR